MEKREPMKDPFKLIDLTHTLSQAVPSWDGSCGFSSELLWDYERCTTETKFRTQKISLHAGIGTHMDAPAHCVPKGLSIADIPLKQLITPCVIIDVSYKMQEDYQVTTKDIENFEEQHGMIEENMFVIIHTGWEQFWQRPEKYHNNHIFPTVSKEAAALLIARNINGLGIDTLSPDCPANDFPVHQIILGAGKYIIENVANAQLMPPRGAYTLALPIKIAGGTEAPMRLVGLHVGG